MTKAIILSAGQGKRLLPLTASTPKCALDVGTGSILETQVAQIRQCDIDEVVVLTGFGADQVDDIARRSRLAAGAHFVQPLLCAIGQSGNLLGRHARNGRSIHHYQRRYAI